MEIKYIDRDGNEQTVEGRLFTGVRDCMGTPIYEGDRVSTYIPTLNDFKTGTVRYHIEGSYPSWIVSLDTPYSHQHLLEKAHGIPSYVMKSFYLDGTAITVVKNPEPEKK